jgi:hypothetical protein
MKDPKRRLTKRALEAATALLPYRCPKCSQWLCDALPCSLAWCEKCGVWVNEQGEIIPYGEVRGYTTREYKRRQAEKGRAKRSVRRRQLELSEV